MEQEHRRDGTGCCLCTYTLSEYSTIVLRFRSLFTAGTLTGFDAAGHIAEETKNARLISYTLTIIIHTKQFLLISVVAARGIFTSAVATGVLGFITAILFLFCTPDLGTLFALEAPQPFVQIYSMALGRGGSVFMTIVAVIGLVMVCYLISFIEIYLTKGSEHNHCYCRSLTSNLRRCS